jgi:hypothetical protein
MGETPNQRECCDIVVRILENTENDIGRDQYAPDERQQETKAADWHVCLAGKHYWIEHTQIEPYEQAIKSGAKYRQLLQKLEEAKFVSLPGHVGLIVSVSHNTYDLQNRDIAETARKAVVEINKRIPSFTNLNDDEFSKQIRFTVDPIEFRLLATTRTPHQGKVCFDRLSPSDLEALRFARIERALSEKIEKFRTISADGNNTVLVLEFEDYILSNHSAIISKIEQICADGSNVPDELFLIDTSQARRQVWHVINNRKIKPDRYLQASH